ncbi:MAG: mechanosensitive ion channel, partial [Mariniphaga sp.]|nr:mechanosensitive ion channel [Mariniphaga sp.]
MSFKEFLNYQIIVSENITFTVYNAIFILIAIIATIIGLKILKRIFNRFIVKKKVERGSYWSVYLIIRYITWVIVIVVLLDSSGVKVSVLLASFAALLVGVGFGIQQLFSDIASGIVLLIERNLQLNDVIQLQDG